MTDTPRLGVSVLGAGRWGKNLVRVFDSLETARLVSVCDIDVARLECLRTEAHRVRRFAEALGDPRVEAVVIATPPGTHADLAVAAFEAGKHVFIEKPMALSTEEARRVLRAAHSHERRGMVGLVLHYHAATEQLRRLVVRGFLGDVEHVVCTRHNTGSCAEDAGTWWSLGPHDVSIVRFLLDREPQSIALARSADGDALRFRAQLQYAGGTLVEISVASGTPDKTRRIVVAGSRAFAVFDDLRRDGQLMVFDASETSLAEVLAGKLPRPTFIPELPAIEPLQVEAAHFVDAVSHGTPFRTDLADGARVVAILEAGQASLDCGGRPISLGGPGTVRSHPRLETADDGSRIA